MNFTNLSASQKRKLVELQDLSQELADRQGLNVDVSVNPRDARGSAVWAKSKEGLDEHSAENGGFTFLFYENTNRIESLFPTLTQEDIARMMFLGTYAEYESNVIKRDRGAPLTKEEIQSLVRLSDRMFPEAFKRWLTSGILIEDVVGRFVLSKKIFLRGKIKRSLSASEKYTRMYHDTIRDLFERTHVRSLGKLSLIYSVLPFVNFHFNVISRNPDCKVSEEVVPMRVSELSNYVGYEPSGKRLRGAMRSLKIRNNPVFAFTEDPMDKREQLIIVNPNVIYAGTQYENLAIARILFSKHR